MDFTPEDMEAVREGKDVGMAHRTAAARRGTLAACRRGEG